MHDITSVRFARVLAEQEATCLPPRRKGISNKEGNLGGMGPSFQKLKEDVGALHQTTIEKYILIGNLNIQVSDLEKEVESKSKQISDLHTHLGALIVCYYDLKSKLASKFGDKFKTNNS